MSFISEVLLLLYLCNLVLKLEVKFPIILYQVGLFFSPIGLICFEIILWLCPWPSRPSVRCIVIKCFVFLRKGSISNDRCFFCITEDFFSLHIAFYCMLTSLTLQLWWTSVLSFSMDRGQETFTFLVESSIWVTETLMLEKCVCP